MKNGILYEIVNKVNNKKYIGVTYGKTINKRWNGHKTCMRSKNDLRPLYNAMRKYGLDNFEINVLMEDVPENYLNLLEQLWIKELNLTNRNKGYNLAIGGYINRGFKMSEDSKLKMSLSHKGEKAYWYGKHHSVETRNKIREQRYGKAFNKGYRHTEEVKQKMSESKKGISSATEHTRKLMSDQRKGENNPSAQSVCMIDKFTDKIVCTFSTMKEAIYWLNKNGYCELKVIRSMIGSIVRVCKDKTKTAYGFRWKYANEGQTTIPNGSTMEDELPLEVQDTLCVNL